MCDDPSVTDLVTRARNDDKQAWDALVERYAPLVWSICRRHGLSDADASDVGESVWLQFASELDQFRAPAAPGRWLAGAGMPPDQVRGTVSAGRKARAGRRKPVWQ